MIKKLEINEMDEIKKVGLKISFDGTRTILARNYNDLINELLEGEPIERLPDRVIQGLDALMGSIGGLLAIYDPGDDDINEIDIQLVSYGDAIWERDNEQN
jgi:hypothetical protein